MAVLFLCTDVARALNIGEYNDGKAQQPLTPLLKTHETQIGKFSKSCRDLCTKLLRLLAMGLQVSKNASSNPPK